LENFIRYFIIFLVWFLFGILEPKVGGERFGKDGKNFNWTYLKEVLYILLGFIRSLDFGERLAGLFFPGN